MRPLLEVLIEENQTIFFKGRCILDSAEVDVEVICHRGDFGCNWFLLRCILVLRYLLSVLPATAASLPSGSDTATPLHLTAAGGSPSSLPAINLLLSASTDINALDAAGHRPADLLPRHAPADLLLLPSSPPKPSYPLDLTLSDIKTGFYGTDEFRIYTFKVKPCSRAYSHDWTECPFIHPGENARRRNPRKYMYSSIPCPEFRKSTVCRNGDACEYAHGVFESWLHQAQYRTRLCKDETGCNRRVCFFAHKPKELRSVNPAAASVGMLLPSSPRSPSIDMAVAMMMMQQWGAPMSTSSLQLPSRLKTSLSARDLDFDGMDLMGLEGYILSPRSNLSSSMRMNASRASDYSELLGSLDRSVISQLLGLSRQQTATAAAQYQSMSQRMNPAYGSSSPLPTRSSMEDDDNMDIASEGGDLEIGLDYEFNAPHFFDLNRPEIPSEALEAAHWFETVRSYPWSTDPLKMPSSNILIQLGFIPMADGFPATGDLDPSDQQAPLSGEAAASLVMEKKKHGRKRKEPGEPKKEVKAEKKVRKPPVVVEGASVERPARERKTVVRLIHMSPPKDPVSKVLTIEQGPGMKLKDIPNGKFYSPIFKIDCTHYVCSVEVVRYPDDGVVSGADGGDGAVEKGLAEVDVELKPVPEEEQEYHDVDDEQNAIVKCGVLVTAKDLFDEMPEKDVVSWNSMISGYASKVMWKEAFKVFERMQRESGEVNSVTWSTIAGGKIQMGRYKEASRRKDVERAYPLFRMAGVRSVITWNMMMAGFAISDMAEMWRYVGPGYGILWRIWQESVAATWWLTVLKSLVGVGARKKIFWRTIVETTVSSTRSSSPSLTAPPAASNSSPPPSPAIS